jgi:hypothetical protein
MNPTISQLGISSAGELRARLGLGPEIRFSMERSAGNDSSALLKVSKTLSLPAGRHSESQVVACSLTATRPRTPSIGFASGPETARPAGIRNCLGDRGGVEVSMAAGDFGRAGTFYYPHHRFGNFRSSRWRWSENPSTTDRHRSATATLPAVVSKLPPPAGPKTPRHSGALWSENTPKHGPALVRNFPGNTGCCWSENPSNTCRHRSKNFPERAQRLREAAAHTDRNQSQTPRKQAIAVSKLSGTGWDIHFFILHPSSFILSARRLRSGNPAGRAQLLREAPAHMDRNRSRTPRKQAIAVSKFIGRAPVDGQSLSIRDACRPSQDANLHLGRERKIKGRIRPLIRP